MSTKVKQAIISIGAIFIYIFLGWTIVIPVLVTKFVLDQSFKTRVKKTFICDDNKFYPGLQETPKYFISKKNKLYGAFFTHEGHGPYKGLIIVSHGIGCSHLNYLQVIDYFSRKDYLVFSFDMTGCCLSEGKKGMEGMHRAIIDLKSAILFASTQEEAKGLKVFVFGHSWSGFASACVLNDKEAREKVDALVTIAGFNGYWDLMEEQGARRVGPIVALARPFARIVSYAKFGKVATYKGIKGINAYSGPVFVAHSKDDPTVPYKYSIVVKQDKCTNKLAEFHTYENLGHTVYRPIECEKAINRHREGKETLQQNGSNVFQYVMDDRYRWSTREEVFGLNEEYMDTIDEFFTKSKGVK